MSFVMNPEYDGNGHKVVGWSVGWQISRDLIKQVAYVKSRSGAAILCNYLNGGSLPLDYSDREETLRLLEELGI